MTLTPHGTDSIFLQIRQDPSLLLALGTGSALIVFLVTAHACCFGLATPHVAALLQICSSAN